MGTLPFFVENVPVLQLSALRLVRSVSYCLCNIMNRGVVNARNLVLDVVSVNFCRSSLATINTET